MWVVVLVFFCSAYISTGKPRTRTQRKDTYYEILGLQKNFTPKQLKKAYRKLSVKYHPDKNKDDKTAKQKFLDVSTAYEVLGDKEKRRVYDTKGEKGLEKLAKRKQQQRGQGNHPFANFFGGGQKASDSRGTDIKLDLLVTLADLYSGLETEAAIKADALCPHCRGSGAADDDSTKECRRCGGKGHTIVKKQIAPGFFQQMQSKCANCQGKGTIITKKCPKCRGKKTVIEERILDITIEKGMLDETTIEFPNAADEHPDHDAGHIIFTVRTIPDALFSRKGKRNLHYEATITLLEALVGFTLSIQHLDGHTVVVTRNTVTKPRHMERVKGEGMPDHTDPSVKGDLWVAFTVVFPRTLSLEQKNGFRKLGLS